MRSHRSPEYNWNYDSKTGFFMRWGKTQEDDPEFSPIGPEILDLEVSTICHGPGIPCSFCYKGNTPTGEYMTHSRFLEILNKLPNNLTQIAFGVGNIDANPDLEKILQSTINRNIVPNITINGYRMDAKWFDILVNKCGSIAVSSYNNDDQCFNTVFELCDRGALQVNIHKVFHDDTVGECLDLIKKIKTDSRLRSLNAVLFLMLKPKGRACNTLPIKDLSKFQQVIDEALKLNVKIGFDSCSAPSVLRSLHDPQFLEICSKLIEPCEAFLFSSYANVRGEFFPCSFCEGQSGWETGLLITPETDFITDIWNHPKIQTWRDNLLKSSSECKCDRKPICRSCPMFDITPCKKEWL